MADGKPKICANCGKLMGVADECPYCGADNRKLGVRLKRVAADEASGVGVTGTLVGINILFFAAALLVGGASPASGGLEVLAPNPEVMFQMGLQYNPAVDAGQWWRIITPIFLHLGLLHVAFNSYILFWAGRLVEEDIGGRLMLLTYLLAGIFGFIASYFADIGGAGASGAVSGMVGFIIVRRRLVDGHFGHPVTRQAIFLTVLNIAIGLSAEGINDVAHGFGYLTGGAMAALLTKVNLGRGGAVGLMLATWATTAVTLVAAVLMTLSLFRGGPADFEKALDCYGGMKGYQGHVQKALAPSRVDPRQLEKARVCLRDLASLESEANSARDQALAGIDAMLKAWDEGDNGGVQRGRLAAAQAYSGFVDWALEAGARYAKPLQRVK